MVFTTVRAVALICFAALIVDVDGECFNRDGGRVSQDYACGIGHTTFCCSAGYTCLSNGICRWTDNTFWLGSCSSNRAADPACTQICPNVKGSVKIIQCSETTWCCSDLSCCSSPSLIYTLPIASALGTIGPGTTGFVAAVVQTTQAVVTSSAVVSTSSLSSSLSSTSITSSTETSSSSRVSDVTQIAVSTTSSGPSSTPTSSPTPRPSNIGAIVGGVIGGIALLALIAAGIFLFRRTRKRTEIPDSTGAIQPEYKPGGEYYQPTPKPYTDMPYELSSTHNRYPVVQELDAGLGPQARFTSKNRYADGTT